MKSLGKAKTKWVWCSIKPKHIDCLGSEHYVRTKDGGIKIDQSDMKQPPNKIKCPDCRHRFIPRVRECHDEGCMHMYIPAHKKRIKIIGPT